MEREAIAVMFLSFTKATSSEVLICVIARVDVRLHAEVDDKCSVILGFSRTNDKHKN